MKTLNRFVISLVLIATLTTPFMVSASGLGKAKQIENRTQRAIMFMKLQVMKNKLIKLK